MFLPLMFVVFSGRIQPLICGRRWLAILVGVPGPYLRVLKMSAACYPGGARDDRDRPSHLLHLPIARPVRSSGGWSWPPLLGILRCPFCQVAYPANYNLPAGPLGPGTSAWALSTASTCFTQPTGPSTLGPPLHSLLGGPPSLWLWGPYTAPVTYGDATPTT